MKTTKRINLGGGRDGTGRTPHNGGSSPSGPAWGRACPLRGPESFCPARPPPRGHPRGSGRTGPRSAARPRPRPRRPLGRGPPPRCPPPPPPLRGHGVPPRGAAAPPRPAPSRRCRCGEGRPRRAVSTGPAASPGAGAAQRKMHVGEVKQNGVCFWKVRRKGVGPPLPAEDRGPIVRTPPPPPRHTHTPRPGSPAPPWQPASPLSRAPPAAAPSRSSAPRTTTDPLFLRLRRGPTRPPYCSCRY